MRLHSLRIEGFRRFVDTTIYFDDATFLIGENNIGKSSVLKTVELILSLEQKISIEDFYSLFNEDENQRQVDSIILTAEFRDVPAEASSWRGFRGRIFNYDIPDGRTETGLSVIYRKTFSHSTLKPIIEFKQSIKTLKPEYANAQKWAEFINASNGTITEEMISEIFLISNFNTKAKADQLELLDEIWDFDTAQEEWFANPGGFPSNVASKLPRYLFIPAQDRMEELSTNSGVLHKTLNELFEDVRNGSTNYQEAQRYLNLLAQELDPTNTSSDFYSLMHNLNDVLQGVFPDSEIHAKADLSNPDKTIKASFDIQMKSNILTPISHQGTGTVRAAVFGLLRYRKIWEAEKDPIQRRSLIIGFEEPEIYLHPNAAEQMRRKIYELAGDDSQIVCTTHSTYMIDLSKNKNQILNRFSLTETEGTISHSFNISESFKTLVADDKNHVKMLIKFDDYMSRVFFAAKIIIIEGDTEEIVLKETINLMPEEIQRKILSNVQIVKARGKAAIISLVKYLNSMELDYFVIHDRDRGTPRAENYNEHILAAMNHQENKRIMMQECIEDELGYPAPSTEKPYNAYQKVQEWENWNSVPENWKLKIQIIFSEYFN
ncbi:MAG: AAA family ATPase [Sulfurovum sp.]|jgi:predicted ATP-dependent endonuclease of OLD family